MILQFLNAKSKLTSWFRRVFRTVGDDPPGESIVSLPGQEMILEWSDTIGKVTSLAQLGRNAHSIFLNAKSKLTSCSRRVLRPVRDYPPAWTIVGVHSVEMILGWPATTGKGSFLVRLARTTDCDVRNNETAARLDRRVPRPRADPPE